MLLACIMSHQVLLGASAVPPVCSEGHAHQAHPHLMLPSRSLLVLLKQVLLENDAGLSPAHAALASNAADGCRSVA